METQRQTQGRKERHKESERNTIKFGRMVKTYAHQQPSVKFADKHVKTWSLSHKRYWAQVPSHTSIVFTQFRARSSRNRGQIITTRNTCMRLGRNNRFRTTGLYTRTAGV